MTIIIAALLQVCVTLLLGYLAAWPNDCDVDPVRPCYFSRGFDSPSPTGLPPGSRFSRRCIR
jgi:hypothetical protein